MRGIAVSIDTSFYTLVNYNNIIVTAFTQRHDVAKIQRRWGTNIPVILLKTAQDAQDCIRYSK